MRVALVTQGYTTAGGVQTVARWLKASLESAGHQVEVHDLANSSRDAVSRRLLFPPSWIQRSLLERQESGTWRWGANLVEFEVSRYIPRRELTAELSRYDIVQVVSGGPAIALAASRSNVPTVLQVATRMEWERANSICFKSRTPAGLFRRLQTRLVGVLEPLALRSVSHVVVENDEMLRYLQSLGVPTVTKAPPGLDTTVFRPDPAGWDPRGYLLSVCRLDDPRKGLDRLVEAYVVLRKKRKLPPRLVLAGRNSLSSSVQRAIAAHGLSSFVDILQNVPQADLPALYRGASVYVQASFEEGLGVSSIEALASGLPVVATRTAGSLEVVQEGLTGLLIDQADEPTVHTRMAVAIGEVLDYGGEMAKHARLRAVEHFSNEAAFARFEAIYRRLVPNDQQRR